MTADWARGLAVEGAGWVALGTVVAPRTSVALDGARLVVFSGVVGAPLVLVVAEAAGGQVAAVGWC